MHEVIDRLIADALEAKRMVGRGCFASNAAAEELLDSGPKVMEDIERSFRQDVALLADGLSTQQLLESVPGLLSVWIVYLTLGKGDQETRIVEFVNSLPESMQATCVLSIASVWNASEGESLPTKISTLVRGIQNQSHNRV